MLQNVAGGRQQGGILGDCVHGYVLVSVLLAYTAKVKLEHECTNVCLFVVSVVHTRLTIGPSFCKLVRIPNDATNIMQPRPA